MSSGNIGTLLYSGDLKSNGLNCLNGSNGLNGGYYEIDGREEGDYIWCGK